MPFQNTPSIQESQDGRAAVNDLIARGDGCGADDDWLDR